MLTEKGQVTIPIKIRRRLGLLPGQELEFTEADGFVKIAKAVSREEMESVRGCLASQPHESVAAYLDNTRGKVALPPKRKTP